jgi:hypothetical protein
MACALSVLLSTAGFIRAVVFRTPLAEREVIVYGSFIDFRLPKGEIKWQ